MPQIGDGLGRMISEFRKSTRGDAKSLAAEGKQIDKIAPDSELQQKKND